MSYTIETDRFLNNLEQVARVRSQIATSLGEIAQTLARWEASVKDTSGGLGLERDIDDLSRASQSLQQTVFRVLVLGLINPDHLDELEQVQNRLRTVFKTYLADYCKNNGQDYYDKRVFEISSLPALRRRLKKNQDSLEGTGFPPFLRALNTFLTQERAVAQLRQVRTLARQVYSRTHAAIERRIPLLDQDIEGLKQRIQGVAPEFEQLTQIRDQFRAEIRTLRDTNVKEIVTSFQTYVLNLETTFESDY